MDVERFRQLNIAKQKALATIAYELSEIDDFRGKSQIVLDIIGPLSGACSIHTYSLNEAQNAYKIASNWYADSRYKHDCLSYIRTIATDEIPQELYNLFFSGEAVIGDCSLFPVIHPEWVRSSLIYGFTSQDTLVGILVLDSDNKYQWDEDSVEFTHTVASMVSSAIRRTIANEILSRQLAWRDKVYPIIAHDLRSGVGSIKMLSQVAAMVQSIGEIQEIVGMIERNADDTFMLLDNLLKWSRLRVGATSIDKQQTELTELLRNVTDSFIPLAASKEISLIMECQQEKYNVEIDSQMISTVVRNLIANALKFTARAGGVVVGGRQVDGKFEIFVQDSGVGMSQQVIDSLLSGSGHVTTYGTEREKGVGLGFSLIRDFLALHDSRIRIESEPGNGSRFTFML